jgi:hypothetical protein
LNQLIQDLSLCSFVSAEQYTGQIQRCKKLKKLYDDTRIIKETGVADERGGTFGTPTFSRTPKS